MPTITPAIAAPPPLPPAPAFTITVNSNQDNIQSDDGLTLREAIALVNGTLTVEQLSATERAQVQQTGTEGASRINFNLPAEQTTIQLTELLPDLVRPGLTIDGTTQPGYEADKSLITEVPMPAPIVAIAPAEGKEILRGLTVTADGITIRGLSLYGFTGRLTSTTTTPPADIMISHRLPPPDISKHPTPANFSEFYDDDYAPKDVVIENNWLGVPPIAQTGGQATGQSPDERSAFGVYVFNAKSPLIRRNWIANHDSSGIITSVSAEGMTVTENVITGNGVAGMPDGIRIEGRVNQAQITGNVVCGNDGSGVYLFKPEGSIQVKNNQITYNGRRFRRAAVYLMGSAHQVTGNQIRYQAGPGVVVAAAPRSDRNQIRGNRFSNLEGLSIDLVTISGTAGTQTHDFQRGDGANPRRDTGNRHKDTGNAAIDAPEFVTTEFLALNTAPGTASDQSGIVGRPVQAESIEIFGTADPETEIDLYRTTGVREGYGALDEPIATTQTDAQGKFRVTLTGVRIGEAISAIASNDRNGTSEPARVARITSLDPATPRPQILPPSSVPRCTTPVPLPPPPPPVALTTPIRLQIPVRIHFALDRDDISPASARVLNRMAEVLRANPSILIELEGHTDPRASDAYNLDLGARRARSARNYLLRQGIAPERMTIRSLGESQRLTTGSTRLDYARDRRVEFRFRDANDIEVVVQEEDLQIE
jgi:outer membrane protein OmpA-like peptidoglycan-associated protein